ncbi:MAG: 23S rRNA (pseudouridine(1915)-N(3))-methyltransferase RlmH [Deltaproteobacteria bacterium]|nr:23S rRNA (pseudouridine(1915)-N(3))-methyltransferase RlmH [Deltaproteobacteria bacterium]
MKITFIAVGGLKAPGAAAYAGTYAKRIERFSKTAFIEIKEESAPASMPRQDILKKEAARILGKIAPGAYVVALADSGREYASRELAGFIEAQQTRGCKELCFITGGAYGLHPMVMERADEVMALSRMTLPHDLARIVLAEQVYRAYTILKGEPYSH